MRKRPIVVVTGFVLSLFAVAAFAAQQQPGRAGKGAPTIEEQVARMKTDLNLTDQQAAQVKELLENQAKDRQTWRANNPNPTREQVRSHRMEMYRQMDEGLKKILTPEQYKKHQELRKQRMQQGMKRGPKGPPQN